ncbi:hypothetical protein [Bradyrhizobium sp. AUGA SZCCT0431]|uniref:hypothetical protein n=1 Tax=Bradyrhizobium sp. AUGA SZCCT0431 TaxID=2807674 RepID=UPI001BAC69AC|nr:hypothetical protein [Bradyrhizobium sp. AUGA SZCCT0431]MBR1142346.1 hypothetical protein [Bradyrhizobium sp. AUGA SZCCT0431]
MKPGGSAVISVYRRNAILKSKLLTRLAAFALGKMVFLPGRGREDLLKSGDANEIVRLYDGVDNPVGKSYTQAQICRMMVDAGFSIEKAWRYYFPLRSLGRMGALLKPLHSFISRRYGLMIAVHVVKPM